MNGNFSWNIYKKNIKAKLNNNPVQKRQPAKTIYMEKNHPM